MPADGEHGMKSHIIFWATVIGTLAAIIGLLAPNVFQKDPNATPTASSPSVSPPVSGPPKWTAIAGPSCPRHDESLFDADPPENSTLDGFKELTGGGWAKDGCTGGAVTTRASVTGPDGAQDTATWWFAPPSTITTCQLSVYVPAMTEPLGVANLWVAGERSEDTYEDNQFQLDLDENAAKGTWVSLGNRHSVKPYRGAVVLQFVDASYESPPATPTLIAASAARITCS